MKEAELMLSLFFHAYTILNLSKLVNTDVIK